VVLVTTAIYLQIYNTLQSLAFTTERKCPPMPRTHAYERAIKISILQHRHIKGIETLKQRVCV